VTQCHVSSLPRYRAHSDTMSRVITATLPCSQWHHVTWHHYHVTVLTVTPCHVSSLPRYRAHSNNTSCVSAATGTYRDSCRFQVNDKKNTLYIIFHRLFLVARSVSEAEFVAVIR